MIRAIHPDRHGPVVADKVAALAIHALDPDCGHITNRQRRSIRLRAQDDRLQFLGCAFLGAGAHAGVCALNLARRVDLHLGGDHRCNLRHGDIMGNELTGGHLDNGAGGGDTANGGAGDAHLKKPQDQLIRQQPQLLRPDRAGDDDIGDPVTPDRALDLRIFGVFGQGGDRIDRVLHIIGGARHVPAGFKIDVDHRAPLARG